MPIKTEDRKRYPENFKDLRKAVLERAGNRCELCGAPHLRLVRRWKHNPATWISAGASFATLHGDQLEKPVRIILTTAHLDPTYQSHDLQHLLALCQRCHLRIDAWLRWAHRQGLEVVTRPKLKAHESAVIGWGEIGDGEPNEEQPRINTKKHERVNP